MNKKILTKNLAELRDIHNCEVCEFCHFFDEMSRCEKKHRPKEYVMLEGPNETTHLRFKNKKCQDWKKYIPTKKEKKKLDKANNELIADRVAMMLAS